MSRRLRLQLKLLWLIVLGQKILQTLGMKQLPPKYLRRLVGGRVEDEDFVAGGERWMKNLRKDARLKKDSKVLDIGCGCGTIVFPLQTFFNNSGRYEGFDVYKELIYWCKRMIEEEDARFNFRLIDLYNKQYNPQGREKANKYRFVYPDNHFDVVMAGSVFTHLLEQDMRHYLREAARVLKPGGYLWVSYFLWRDESRKAMEEGKSVFNFGNELSKWSRTENKKIPETAVCYDEKKLRQWYGEVGLEIKKVSYGNWVDKQADRVPFQDIVVAIK